MGNDALPPKAQGLLGSRGRMNLGNSKDNGGEQRKLLRKVEQKNLAIPSGFVRPPGNTPLSAPANMPSWSNTNLSTRSSSDILPTPSTSSPQVGGVPRNGGSAAVQLHQFYPERQHSIESMRRGYYNASAQPLYVSQQTSASAVRDMGLRKGSPTVQEIASAPPSAPLKSAMKHPKPNLRANGKTSPKKPKNLDLTSLFPRPRPADSGRLLSPAKFSHSPSALTDKTEFFPQETTRVEVRRQGHNGRFGTYKSTTPASVESGSTNSNSRVKVFEPDIFDRSKTHTRRPPKGIQNWFDGFDVSSDEEEQQEPVELPANPPRLSVEALPSDFSPYVAPAPGQAHLNGYHPTRPQQKDSHPVDPAKELMRRRMQRNGSESSTVTGSSSSAAIPGGRKHSAESRLANSKLESQSVLSLSSESEDERNECSGIPDSRIFVEEASKQESHRPMIPPRRMNFKQGSGRVKSSSTTQTSGSIPIRLTDTDAALTAPDQNIQSDPDPAFADGLCKLGGLRDSRSQPSPSQPSTSQPSRSRRSTQSARTLQSAGGETTSSEPSDASRVMAVTEEEMMLLELMRKKRAAMQKNSFSEGYRLALKQEQEHLTERRKSAHHAAVNVLKEKEEPRPIPVPTAVPSNGRESRDESLMSEEPDQIRRYSAIRKQDVDKSFKMGRFFAMEAPQEEEPYVVNMARMERFLMMKPSLADAIQERPPSGTEIEADSMTQTETEGDEIELAATEEEEFVAPPPSPMQRLTQMARGPRQATPLREELTEDYFDDERAFLTSSHYSENPSTAEFPSPPGHSPLDMQKSYMSMLPPAMPEDEALTPKLPERSPNRTPLNEIRKELRLPGTTKLPAASKPRKADHLKRGADLAALEVPTARTGSPSISTSRPSPLTPTFPITTNTPMDHTTVQIAGSDTASFQASPYRADPGLPHGVNAGSAPSRDIRKLSKKMPSRIDTKSVDRVTSMTSITSAGEDVLAAWAELGGGSDAFTTRRRGR